MVIIDFIDFILKARLTVVVFLWATFFGNFHIVQSFPSCLQQEISK